MSREAERKLYDKIWELYAFIRENANSIDPEKLKALDPLEDVLMHSSNVFPEFLEEDMKSFPEEGMSSIGTEVEGGGDLSNEHHQPPEEPEG